MAAIEKFAISYANKITATKNHIVPFFVVFSCHKNVAGKCFTIQGHVVVFFTG